VETFFEYIAEEVRELLAELGFRSHRRGVGAVDALDIAEAVDHFKTRGLDLTPILHEPTSPWEQDRYCSKGQDHGLDKALDNELIRLAEPALEREEPVTIELPSPTATGPSARCSATS
jgi:glutamate synthase (NADPH) large chain